MPNLLTHAGGLLHHNGRIVYWRNAVQSRLHSKGTLAATNVSELLLSQVVPLPGHGQLRASAMALLAQTVTLRGRGALSGLTAQRIFSSATFSARGALTGRTIPRFFQPSGLTGRGVLSAAVNPIMKANIGSPVVYDATSAPAFGINSPTGIAATHLVGENAVAMLIGVTGYAATLPTSSSVTVAGTPATLLGFTVLPSSAGWVELWGVRNPLAGAQQVIIYETIADGYPNNTISSVSYSGGVRGFGTAISASGISTTQSTGVITLGVNDIVGGVVALNATPTAAETFRSVTGAQALITVPIALMQDTATSGGIGSTSTSTTWGAIGCDLQATGLLSHSLLSATTTPVISTTATLASSGVLTAGAYRYSYPAALHSQGVLSATTVVGVPTVVINVHGRGVLRAAASVVTGPFVAAPVVFDRSGEGNRSLNSVAGITETHVMSLNATAMLIGVTGYLASTQLSQTTTSVTVGGVPATLIGAMDCGSSSAGSGWVELWGLLNPPVGAQTVAVYENTSNGYPYNVLVSASYAGVTGWTGFTSAVGVDTSVIQRPNSGGVGFTAQMAAGVGGYFDPQFPPGPVNSTQRCQLPDTAVITDLVYAFMADTYNPLANSNVDAAAFPGSPNSPYAIMAVGLCNGLYAHIFSQSVLSATAALPPPVVAPRSAVLPGHGALAGDQRIRLSGHGQLSATIISAYQPPAYDATAAGRQGVFVNLAWSHTAAAGSTVVAVVMAQNLGHSTTPSAVTYGGSPAYALLQTNSPGNTGVGMMYMAVWQNVPGGAQTVAFSGMNSGSGGVYAAGNSVSYQNVISIGTPNLVFGTGTSMSQTVSCAIGDLAVQAFANMGAAVLSTPTGGINRCLEACPNLIGGDTSMTISDTVAVPTTTFGASLSGTDDWAGTSLLLLGAQVSYLHPGLRGRGALTATTSILERLSGHGSLTATAGRLGNLLGHGALTAAVRINQSRPAVLAGHGALSTIIGLVRTATITGRGALTATAQKAVQLDVSSPSGTNVSGATSMQLFPLVTGNYIIAAVATISYTAASSVTCGATPMTLLGTVNNTTNGGVQIFALINSGLTGTQTITVSWGGSTVTAASGSAMSFSNVAAAAFSSTGGLTPGTFTLPVATAPGNAVYGVATATVPTNITPLSAFLQNVEFSYLLMGSAPRMGMTTGYSVPDPGVTSVNVGATMAGSSDHWSLTGVNLAIPALVTATISGAGRLTAAAILHAYNVSASLSGHGALSASAVSDEFVETASLHNHGVLTATTLPKIPVAAALPGHGVLTTTARAKFAVTAALPGRGALTATTIAKMPVTAALSSHGVWTATTSTKTLATVALPGHGALTATTLARIPVTPALTGHGALTATTIAKIAVTATLSGHGVLTATARTAVTRTAALSGHGVLTATAKPSLNPQLTGHGQTTATASSKRFILTAALPSHGALSATTFVAITEVNVVRTGQALPTGTHGVWVTIFGAGAGGGAGSSGAFSQRGGGGGGGGGSALLRTFIPRASLGTTYTTVIAAAPAAAGSGGNTSFASNTGTSSIVTCAGGTAGGTGTATAGGTAGAGGTTSSTAFSGVSFTGNLLSGTIGTVGSSGIAVAPAPTANTVGSGAGGGGGGGRNGSNTPFAASAGAASTAHAGGAAGTTAPTVGGNPGGVAGQSGAGGGGGGTSGSTAAAGGPGGISGGAGGGGGGSDTGAAGGAGSAGYLKLEWV